MRKPPPRSELHFFSGKIEQVGSLRIALLGTDSAVGKRTTAWHPGRRAGGRRRQGGADRHRADRLDAGRAVRDHPRLPGQRLRGRRDRARDLALLERGAAGRHGARGSGQPDEPGLPGRHGAAGRGPSPRGRAPARSGPHALRRLSGPPAPLAGEADPRHRDPLRKAGRGGDGQPRRARAGTGPRGSADESASRPACPRWTCCSTAPPGWWRRSGPCWPRSRHERDQEIGPPGRCRGSPPRHRPPRGRAGAGRAPARHRAVHRRPLRQARFDGPRLSLRGGRLRRRRRVAEPRPR